MKKLILLFIIIVLPVFIYAQDGAKAKKPGSTDKNGNERVNTEESVKETTSNYEDDVKNYSSNIFIDSMEVDRVELSEFTFDGVYPNVKGLSNKSLEKEINQIFISNYKNYLKKSKGWGLFIHATTNFEILSLSDDLISIIQYYGFTYEGGNGWGSDAEVVNVDLEKGRLLTNNDLNLDDVNISEYNKTVFMYFLNQDMFMDNSYVDPLEYYRKEDEMNFIPIVKTQEEFNKINFGIKNNELCVVEFASPGARVYETVYIIPINKKYSSNSN